MLWSKRAYNHTIVYWRGQPIYKNWDKDGHPSALFNRVQEDGCWPSTVWIIGT